MFGGIDKWTAVGKTMTVYGINFWPAFWGFASGFVEFAGGLCIVFGLFYRFIVLMVFVNLMIAFSSQMLQNKGYFKSAQSLEDGMACFAMIFVGPGKYSMDYLLKIDLYADMGNNAYK